MIKIIQAQYVQQRILRLYFSDNSFGDYDLQALIDRQTELVMALNDDVYFKQFFLELGALCWPNGLELSLAIFTENWLSNTNCTTTPMWPMASVGNPFAKTAYVGRAARLCSKARTAALQHREKELFRTTIQHNLR